MANLAISTVCNQTCAYCFTIDHLQEGRKPGSGSGMGPGPVEKTNRGGFLPITALQERLDFLERSDIREVRLLGGEPTLHPQFVEVVSRARSADMRVVVFTNGLMPEGALTCLEALPPEGCTVMVNVNQPAPDGGDRAYERRRYTMKRLGMRVLPGFNICRSDFEMKFLLSLINETGCKSVIRLGMAQPCLSGDNQYIHPNQYRAIAVRIVQFASVAARAGVKLDFDCGFVRCMFSDEDIEVLEATGANVGWRCNPILDVDIKGNVIHCYPLSRLSRLPLTPETDASILRRAFEERTRPYRQTGVFKECSICPFKAAGDCSGGCLAATIRRFRHTPFRLEMTGETL